MSLSNLSAALFSVASLINRGPSLLGECLALVAACTTMADCDRVRDDFAAVGSVWRALSPADRQVVKVAGQTRRMMITMATIPGPALVAPSAANLAIVTDMSRSNGGDGRTPDQLRSLALELDAYDRANAPAVPAPRVVVAAPAPRAPRTVRAQSPELIAEATRVARIVGANLAGYDGRIVDPSLSSGVGTVIAFGKSRASVDGVSGRMRQSLIPWAQVEAVRLACDLPERAFGRAPGLVGLLGKATQILNHGGYVARNVKTAGKFASAWKIGFFDNEIESDSLGRKEALITLSHSGEIVCDAPDHDGANAVLADYDRRVAGTMIASDDLVIRIEACLVNHYGARDTDLGTFVAPFNSARAVALVESLRPVVGRRIFAYAHMDAASMSVALSDSFEADLAALEKAIASKAEIKKIAGASLIETCERLRAEIDGLSAILGSENVLAYRARIASCDALVVAGLDAASQRASMLDLRDRPEVSAPVGFARS